MGPDASHEASCVQSLLLTADNARIAHAHRRRRPKHAGAASKVALAWRRPRAARAATAPGHPLQGMQVGAAQRQITAQPSSSQLTAEVPAHTLPHGSQSACSAGTVSCINCYLARH